MSANRRSRRRSMASAQREVVSAPADRRRWIMQNILFTQKLKKLRTARRPERSNGAPCPSGMRATNGNPRRLVVRARPGRRVRRDGGRETAGRRSGPADRPPLYAPRPASRGSTGQAIRANRGKRQDRRPFRNRGLRPWASRKAAWRPLSWQVQHARAVLSIRGQGRDRLSQLRRRKRRVAAAEASRPAGAPRRCQPDQQIGSHQRRRPRIADARPGRSLGAVPSSLNRRAVR